MKTDQIVHTHIKRLYNYREQDFGVLTPDPSLTVTGTGTSVHKLSKVKDTVT